MGEQLGLSGSLGFSGAGASSFRPFLLDQLLSGGGGLGHKPHHEEDGQRDDEEIHDVLNEAAVENGGLGLDHRAVGGHFCRRKDPFQAIA